MPNIVDYIRTDQRTFAESPFNAVDSLVCSSLSYFNFEECAAVPVGQHGRMLLHDVICLSDWKALTSHNWLEDAKDTEPFLQALMASRRYRSAQVAFYANEMSSHVEKQFSAVTLFFPDGSPAAGDSFAYLSFRGTDGTFAGWKEDFNLCFKQVIPSQRAAASYVSGVASACTCPLMFGGHSKGGNLAEYAALVCDQSVYDRLERIYNHDGPSFLEPPSPRMDSPQFLCLLDKTVPESSAFGMILERRNEYRIVQADAFAIFQHAPFSWQVEGTDFVGQDQLTKSAAFFDETLDSWLRSKTPEEREVFIDSIFEMISSTNATSFSELQDSKLATIKSMIETSSNFDADTKKFLRRTLGTLGVIIKDETVRRIKNVSFPFSDSKQ